MSDHKANNVSLMEATAVVGCCLAVAFFSVLNLLVTPALPLVVAVTAQAEAFFSCEISAARTQFPFPASLPG